MVYRAKTSIPRRVAAQLGIVVLLCSLVGAAKADEQWASAALAPSRAAVLIAKPDDIKNFSTHTGSAIWTKEIQSTSQASGEVLRADIEVPDLAFHTSFTIHRTEDPSVGATHIIDIKFLASGPELASCCRDVAMPQMRSEHATSTTLLIGAIAKISVDHYLFGLSAKPNDKSSNMRALSELQWFDVPFLLADGRVAKVTFDKGLLDQRVLTEILDVTGEPKKLDLGTPTVPER